ncbi:MAG: methyltransferase domain-containing protein [Candidatus Omnitrophica bacterium]|nr:methyltransferase domain-containing protein [Candidatus Omnitrophota bacterium]
MKIDFAKQLKCPSCGRLSLENQVFEKDREEVKSGMLICPDCRTWYPVIDSIPIVTKNPLLADDAKKILQEKWGASFNFSSFRSNPQVLDPQAEDLQRHQIEHYNEEAENYDREIPNRIFWKSVVATTIRPWAEATKTQGYSTLEIGCGTGNSTIQFIEAGHQVIGLDICFAAVKQALAKVRARGMQDSVHFVVSEAEALPFPSMSFQAVTFSGVLHHVSSPEQVLKEIGRTLKNGGLVYGHENNKTAFRFIFDFLMSLNRLWHEEAGAHPLISPDQAKQWGRAGGIDFQIKTMVFLPPHLLDLFPFPVAKMLLSATDHFFQRFPWIRHHGGLIILFGKKQSPIEARNPCPMESVTS